MYKIDFNSKWNSKAKVKRPKKFMEAYNTEAQVITRDNFYNFKDFTYFMDYKINVF